MVRRKAAPPLRKSARPAGREPLCDGSDAARKTTESAQRTPEGPSPVAGVEAWPAFLTARRLIVFFGVASALVLLLAVVATRRDLAVLLGERAQAKKDWATAARRFLSAYGEAPESAAANIALGQCFVETGKMQEAMRYLDSAQAKIGEANLTSKDRALLYALRGRALLDLGEKDRAVEEAQKALKEDPRQPLANFVMARHYLEKNEVLKAGTFFGRLAGIPEYAGFVGEFKSKLNESVLDVPDSEVQDVPERDPALKQPSALPDKKTSL